ncbi:formylglycine-generating enzyme family protein [Pseudanabaena yagii GIHE-NHR1]|uniref:Formylglycine-generating enzyme family protein n=2 Tax=Pseudanabaena TaxID=1152 RepID=A0ABX1M0U5_9CYAN|nr:formylglycine-generating enzyme family protein [Pseudanabaena yagii GIHE-NHR1]
MGSPMDEKDCRDNEKPQHNVSIQSFFMGKYPITQAQWQIVSAMPKVKRDLKPEPSRFKGDNRPVEQVSWLEVIEFCTRLSIHTGRKCRLPSEAEWEYACRAGTTTAYSFGSNLTKLSNHVWYSENSRGQTHPIGQMQPNSFGLFDMHGNVWEWCADDWHDNYGGAPENGISWIKDYLNYEAPQSLKMLRGGSWFNLSNHCRSAFRYFSNARRQYDDIGFRVACSIQ